MLADRAARLAPLTDADADELIRSIRAAPLLLGRPGTPGADLTALRDLLLRVSRMADDLPQIAELELSPVFARPDGAEAVDARIRLRAAGARRRQPVRNCNDRQVAAHDPRPISQSQAISAAPVDDCRITAQDSRSCHQPQKWTDTRRPAIPPTAARSSDNGPLSLAVITFRRSPDTIMCIPAVSHRD